MAKIETAVTIARPGEVVFDYFLALDENVPRTNPDVEYVVKTPDGPTTIGTTLRVRGKSLGRVRETSMRYNAIIPNEEIRFEGEVGPMRPEGAFLFDRIAGGTRVTFQGDPRPVGVFKLLGPLFNRLGRRVWSQRLARAKAALEASRA
jgi:hypothetical protein